MSGSNNYWQRNLRSRKAPNLFVILSDLFFSVFGEIHLSRCGIIWDNSCDTSHGLATIWHWPCRE